MKNLLRPTTLIAIFAATLAAGGCMSPDAAERNARTATREVGQALRVGERIAAPAITLTPASPETEFVRYALYHHPAVRAAYFEWKASVAAIAPARALPDPQLTFQADIAGVLMSLMPGLMFDVMGAGKRAAMAREATAGSEVAYQAYVAEVVRTAGEVHKAWVELAYASDVDRLYRQTIHAAQQATELANADYLTRRGMANFDEQVRLQNVLAQHHAHHAAVAEQVAAARSRLKSALGLLPTDPDPAWPAPTLTLTVVPPETELWARIAAANPDLARMRAMVDMAVAGEAVARTGGRPDFSIGAMVDVKADPRMVRPTATLTLPVWREKIRANVAAAAARRDAAAARVTAEQLTMAAQLARMLSMLREADSMVAYMTTTALPNLDRALTSAEASVQAGMGNSAMITEVELMALDMKHQRLKALRDRENAAADLAIMLADVLPDGAPLRERAHPGFSR